MDPNRFHTIDVIAYSVMPTHLRLVVTAPNELPDHQETARRFKASHPGKQLPVQGSEQYERLRGRTDARHQRVCEVAADVLYLWAQSSAPQEAMWSSVKDVKLNAVRHGPNQFGREALCAATFAARCVSELVESRRPGYDLKRLT